MPKTFFVRVALALASALTLASAAWAVWQFEQTLKQGQVVLLELAPVDPRSLMQGDYMALGYALERDLNRLLNDKTKAAAEAGAPQALPRFAYLRLDAERRAAFDGVGDSPVAGKGGEMQSQQPNQNPNRIAVRIRPAPGQVRLGPNAFFFQEGTAKAYEPARWGEFRVAPDGKALLVALRDKELKPLGFNRF